MAEKKELTVEERLAKATECYKDLKAKYDEKESRLKEAEAVIAEYKSRGGISDVALSERIKELEAEIAINGNSSEEIKSLNARLDKAKEIFAEQKAKIAELKASNEKIVSELKTNVEQVQNLTAEIEAKNDEINAAEAQILKYSEALSQVQKIIAGL